VRVVRLPRAVLRPYREGDRDAVYDVCVRTGDAGEDASGQHPDDDLLPDVYAGPYLALEPDLALVLDDGERAVGYVLGTADTAGSVRAWRRDWLPGFAQRHPAPAGPPRTPSEHVVVRGHEPEQMLVPGLEGLPAHLHIDLLPDHQGVGHGAELVRAFLALVAARGAGGLHVGVDPRNARARGFYARLGFTPVPGAPDGYFGIPTR